MPFAVFRRHQKKLLAVLAIFAMVAFTLDFSLFRNKFGRAPEDTLVATLNGRNIYRSDLAEMMAQRNRANIFMQRLTQRPDYFGGLNNRALVDAMILENEANRLKMPAKPDLAIKFLRQITNNQLNTDIFNRIYQETFADQVTDDQLLTDIANQIRLADVRGLPGLPEVTPLDVYQAYRDQNEQVSAFAAPFYVEDYVTKVKDPADSELRAYFDKYKNTLPDPNRDTPGFMIPRRVRVEFVSLDGRALARELKPKLTEKELRETYAARPTEFPLAPPEIPLNVFAGDPKAELTPRVGDPFDEVQPLVASAVADEKAQEEINRKFGELKDETMLSFYEKYDQVAAENKEAKELGKSEAALPSPGDLLKQAATRLSLKYEKTPEIDRDEAERYPEISSAKLGTGQSAGSKSFVEVFFDPKAPMFDPIELSDDAGRRYLAWKISDSPSRVPTFDESRSAVLASWKSEKARVLAESDAKALADKARAAGGNVKQVAGSRLLLTIPPIAKLQPDVMLNNPFQFGKPRPVEIPQVPRAGEEFRKAYFSLAPGTVNVAPNDPKSIYYVLSYNQGIPAEIAKLYSTFGPQAQIRSEVFTEALSRRAEEWMSGLRRRAGLDPNWVPPDEARNETTASNG